MTRSLQQHILSLALAAFVTLGLLAGVDRLASHEATSGAAAQARAQVAAQAAAQAAAKAASRTLPSA